MSERLPQDENIEHLLSWALNQGYSKATEYISEYCKSRNLIVTRNVLDGVTVQLIFQPANQRPAYKMKKDGSS